MIQQRLHGKNEAFHSARDFTTQTIEDSDFDFETVKDQAASFYSSIVDSNSAQEPEQEQATPLELTTPEDQYFSIGNVELGDTRTDVEDMYGEPERESENEYGVNWSTYSEGHRENILQDNFAELGVGVDFNDDNQPFFTENFLNDQWLY